MANGAIQSGVLGDVAEVRLGHSFRGAIPAVAGGSVGVVQIRDLGPAGIKGEAGLLRTEVTGRKAPDWLADGDILLVARGSHPSATHLVHPPARTVCSPHFYVIRVKQPNRLLPAFLAWQLNQPPAQRYLRQSAEGSLQLSIRRGVLEYAPVQIPPLDRQHAVIALAHSAEAERTALQALIKNRETELALLAERLLNTSPEAA